MFDPKWIRDNADAFDAGRARRGLPPLAATVIELDGRRRATQTAWQEMQEAQRAFQAGRPDQRQRAATPAP
jgi:seryl-tRNA synthetase